MSRQATLKTAQAIEDIRHKTSQRLCPDRRAAFGQYMTPWPIADFMAALCTLPKRGTIKLLDPGAGVGSLSAAFAEQWLNSTPATSKLAVTAVELDESLHRELRKTLAAISKRAKSDKRAGVSEMVTDDFITYASEALLPLYGAGPAFTHAILNPPYKKISVRSTHRRLTQELGVQTVNLYAAFIVATVSLLKDKGECVAIIPRSWCNGTYYRPFRNWLFEQAALTHLHLFDSRNKAFKDDSVLQENVILRLVRGGVQHKVCVSRSSDGSFADYSQTLFAFDDIVNANDRERYVHIPTGPRKTRQQTNRLFAEPLEEVGLSVSTGPVVDFRVKDQLRKRPSKKTVPLLYPQHFRGGTLKYPVAGKKPNAIVVNDKTKKWLYPSGYYVITKRFTSKEEKRRVVAHVIDPATLPGTSVGLENHVNVFHRGRKGLNPDVAHGLALFLNSTVVDKHFREFSGHTQVNATDLRRMRYPSEKKLRTFGRWARKKEALTQAQIDKYLKRHL